MLDTAHQQPGRFPLAPADAVERQLEESLAAFARRQNDEGVWPARYDGALFLTPLFVIAAEVSQTPLTADERRGLCAYLLYQQNGDGGWGLHVGGESRVFTTTLAYVALRLLDREAQAPEMGRARQWLAAAGGVLSLPSWGKFAMALMNLYDYAGLHPVLPELWLLPRQVPAHPGRLWCHTRMVYLPMAYLHGIKAHVPLSPLVEALRTELYGPRGWAAVDWPQQRNHVAHTDLYRPHGRGLELLNLAQAGWEAVSPPALRRKALAQVLDHIRYEDETTDYVNLGPVNKLFNTVACFFARGESPELQRHRQRLREYLWLGPHGIHVQGYHNTHLWDTAFALQAFGAAPQRAAQEPTIRRSYRFLKANQLLENLALGQHYHRQPIAGGWPFSDRRNGWPVSDCTAEALEVSLALDESVGADRIPQARLELAVDYVLAQQNRGGGWASYEKQQAPPWLERLNPSEIFGDIMVERPYPECTASCVRALAAFTRRFPTYRARQIAAALRRGQRFLLQQQRSDGSWYGSWGVCFTYGTWFGIAGLRASGLPATHPAVRQAEGFLLSKQRPDGGWGESGHSCWEGRHIQHLHSQVVMTSWALLGLLDSGCTDRRALDRAVAFLLARRRSDGLWPREGLAGVFNHTCLLNYDNYRHIFPLWALGRYLRHDEQAPHIAP